MRGLGDGRSRRVMVGGVRVVLTIGVSGLQSVSLFRRPCRGPASLTLVAGRRCWLLMARVLS